MMKRFVVSMLGTSAALLVAAPARGQLASAQSASAQASRSAHASAASDSAAALAVFRENIDAIHKRDHPRYLRTYLQTPGLTLGGLRGVQRGWMDWPARTDSNPTWPDTLIANELRVAPMAPGVVYGAYRYRGIVQGKASVGISERVFVKTPRGWKISYTASFPDTLPP
jgi:hypothetical protein